MRLLILNLILLFTIASCSKKNADSSRDRTPEKEVADVTLSETYGKETQGTLLFIDVTDSNIVGEQATAFIQEKVEERLVSPGDKLGIYFITPNTATTQTKPELEFVVSLKPIEEVPGATIINKKRKKNYAQQLKAYTNKAVKDILQETNKQMEEKFSNSDVLGLFKLAHREFSDKAYSDFESKQIYVISDLEQYCSSGGGYFKCPDTKFVVHCDGKNGRSLGQAEKDASVIKNKLGSFEKFNDVEFYITRGDKCIPNFNSKDLNKLNSYWEKLTEEIKFKKVVI